MPTKPQRHSAPGGRRSGRGTLRIVQEQRKQTTTERGYGWQWQKLRLVILQDEPLCRACTEEGRVTPAAEVDHIDGDSHNNDRDNLRPLCRPCHLQRTAKDQAFGKMQWRPEWLRPSTIPLTIVCGPPASGKTSYVTKNAGPKDLIIDLDVIASRLSGQSLHSWDRGQWLVPSIRARNEMLGDIGRPTKQWPQAWLILSEAKPDLRQWWHDKVKPREIIVLETPASVCIERVRSASDRNRDSNFDTIARWWEAYGRREGDVIIR